MGNLPPEYALLEQFPYPALVADSKGYLHAWCSQSIQWIVPATEDKPAHLLPPLDTYMLSYVRELNALGGAYSTHFLHNDSWPEPSIHLKVMRLLGDPEHCLIEIKSLTQEQKGTITLQTILDSTDDFIFAYDKHYRLVHYNEATRRLWAAQGINLKLYANLPEELSYEAWMALKPIVDRALAGETVTLEYPFQFPGEDLKHYSVTYTPVYDHENQVMGTVGYARDITQRVEAEQQLAHRTAELERKHAEMCAFLDNLPLGVYILKPTGEPYYANTYTRKLFDFLAASPLDPNPITPEIIQTTPIQELIPQINVLRSGSLQSYPLEELPIGRALNGEFSYVDDMLVQRPLGPMRLEVIGSPVFDDQGQLQFAMAVFSDISERKEQERALAQKNEELLAQQQELIERQQFSQLLADLSQDYITVFNRDEQLVFYNQRCLELEELGTRFRLGMSAAETFRDTYPFFKPLIEEVFQGETRYWERTFQVPEHLQAQLGDTLYYQFVAKPSIDAQGQTRLCIIFATDVTNNQRQLKLIEAQRARAKRNEELLLRLTRRPETHEGELQTNLNYILSELGKGLGISLVSFWLRHETTDHFTCEAAYDYMNRPLESFPNFTMVPDSLYYRGLQEHGWVEVLDKDNDPIGQELAASFEQHHTQALFDVPIWVGGQLEGILCCEQVAPTRKLEADEQALIIAVGELIAREIETARRLAAQRDLELKERELAQLNTELQLRNEELKQNLEVIADVNHDLEQARMVAEEQKREIETIINSTDDFVVVLDHGRILYMNEAFDRFLRAHPVYATKEVKFIFDFYEDPANNFMAGLRERSARGETIHAEMPNPFLVKGGITDFYITINALFNTQGEVTAVVAFAKDITNLKALQRELEAGYEELALKSEELETNLEELTQAYEELHSTKEYLQRTLDELRQTQSQLIQVEKMSSLGQLTAGIAHEINNPINYVYSGSLALGQHLGNLMDLYTQAIEVVRNRERNEVAAELDRLFSEDRSRNCERMLPKLRELLETVQIGSARTSEIVQGLRNFSRSESGQREPVDLAQGIGSTLLLLRHRVDGKVDLQVDMPEELPTFMGYPGQLNQVWLNLLANAIDAVEERFGKGNSGGIITLRVVHEANDKQITVLLTDNGVGITQEQQKHLFEPFYTSKPVGKGTGLGLAITYGILQRHNGSIQFRSTPGQGTTVEIVLPLVVA